MRVAQVMAGAPAGGAELFFERLCAALARAGDGVLPVIRRNQERAARLRAAGLAPVQLAFGSGLDLISPRRLAASLQRFAPGSVVAWMSRAARIAPKGRWALIGRLGGYYDLRNFGNCEHLAANTHGLVDWIVRQGWPAARVHYLPNFVPDLASAEPVGRVELGVPEGAPLLLGLGRLHRNKAFDILIRALALLPEAFAVIAGEGPERPALEALARELGVSARLRLPGWRQDGAALLAGCDVLVCPSRQEPLGNVVLEAWSARRPVVAAAAEGPAELIRPGETGLLAPVEDAAALARAVASLLADRRASARLAEAGRAAYERDFAEAPVLAQWRGFLASVERR
ncbi:MAG TPA: glycosyltransferase [Acetobacteraceae bacterium]|nr:glycosyltransferase [Acetobacteraceae bacterium]